MGTQPSKLNKVVSRSTIESTTSSSHNHKHQSQLGKDHLSVTSSSNPRPHSNNAPSLDWSEQGSGQFSDQGNSQISGTNSAGTRSRSNLSSFLSSILGGYNTVESTVPNEKDDNDHALDDLKEQKQQKKVNRMNQKTAKQLQKQQQQQHHPQPHSPKVAPYQQPSPPSVNWSTLINSDSYPPLAFSPAISEHSTAQLSSSTATTEQSTSSKSKAKSANGMLLSSGADTALTSPSPDAASPLPTQSSTSLPLNGVAALPRTLHPSSSIPLVLQDQSMQLKMSPAASQQLLPPPPKKSKKSSFIRGKAGFAWLEKRLPPASMGLDDETLNNKSWNYHNQGRLLDEMEIEAAKGYVDRITDQHYLMKDVMGGNYHVPMDLTFKCVLENGCGAGDWTLDMASELPEADFVGCPQMTFTKPEADNNNATPRPRGLLGADQSQQQGSTPGSKPPPSAATVNGVAGSTIRPTIRPRNCTFYPDVPINRLPYRDNYYDFVYQRRQNVILLANEWQRTVDELFRVLKPGGWLELLEPDLFVRGGGELCQFAGRYCVGMFEGTGRNPNMIHELQPLLERAGFVNVEVKVWSIPLGWGGVIGQAMSVNQRQFVNEMKPIYVRQGHGTAEEYEVLTKKIFEEAVEKQGYINYHIATGQKPQDAASSFSFPSMTLDGFKRSPMLQLERCIDEEDDDTADENENENEVASKPQVVES